MTNPENKTFPTPPVLLIIFARSECARKVLASIRTARPSQIYIAQDAPRPNRPDDVENCRLARETTLSEIDWDCEIKTLFQEKNLGAGKGCAAAIQWFFENVEEGIVLEDDDLPEPSFFPYCAELLDKYRNDTRVMHIAGYNPLLKPVSDDSYYFSKLMHCWGFATWRRVIKQYDYKISSWHKLKKTGHMRTIFRQRFPRWHFTKEFEMYSSRDCNNWDPQLLYLILSKNGLCINPNVNLIKNIGFGEGATFAQNPWSYHGHRTTEPIHFPLKHPDFVFANQKVDEKILKKSFKLQPLRYFLVQLAMPYLSTILRIAKWLRLY